MYIMLHDSVESIGNDVEQQPEGSDSMISMITQCIAAR